MLSTLWASTLTSNSSVQKPGGIGRLAGIMIGLLGVNTTSFGALLTGWVVDQMTPQVVVIVGSPSYSTIAPSSVQGIPSAKFELQSRSNRSRFTVSLVPFWMLPVPRVS
ncbi:MAG: hypothetical protein E6J79_05795 [Deltaproteobacteria bacterium]|nr:MAG: hypothetical protein E6J79_05795 [Deltaproteobacteria bacterium]